MPRELGAVQRISTGVHGGVGGRKWIPVCGEEGTVVVGFAV